MWEGLLMIIIKGISWWLSVIRSFSNSKPGEMTKETFVTKKKKKRVTSMK